MVKSMLEREIEVYSEIDSYVTNLASHEEGKKLQLHYWYIGEHEIHGEMRMIRSTSR